MRRGTLLTQVLTANLLLIAAAVLAASLASDPDSPLRDSATIGLVLWVQETYDAYATWAYAWALVAPTAPGVGTLLYGAVKGDGAEDAKGGG